MLMRKNSFVWALLYGVILVSGLTGGAATGHALETEWQGNKQAQLRLIAGQADWLGKSQLFVAIEIKLAPKWKTYWRTPGETGIPPYFDWSGSENLLSAEVLYPFPKLFEDEAGSSIGYKSRVTLPVVITPKDVTKPVKLVLNAQYAICYDLCVPVSANHSLLIDDVSTNLYGPVVSLALSAIPTPVSALLSKAKEMPESKFGVSDVVLSKVKGRANLKLKIQVPAKTKVVDLFVEGPDGLYVPSPKMKKNEMNAAALSQGGKVEYGIDLEQGDDVQKFEGAVLTCTLRADERAIVQPCKVE